VLELVIRGATVYPGEGTSFSGDVAIDDGGIALVTPVGAGPHPEACEVVDADGLLLCPGFIDLHAHSALRSLEDPFLTPKLAQASRPR
jgi:N-acyl-D-amino-acid deacylase